MLATLITGDDRRMGPLYGRIRDYLDRGLPSGPDLQVYWRRDVDTLHRIWRNR